MGKGCGGEGMSEGEVGVLIGGLGKDIWLKSNWKRGSDACCAMQHSPERLLKGGMKRRGAGRRWAGMAQPKRKREKKR